MVQKKTKKQLMFVRRPRITVYFNVDFKNSVAIYGRDAEEE